MIRHLLRLIYNQRRQNGWLWAELLLVSVLLWFLVDYLYVTVRTYTAPLGFNIEHTYFIGLQELSTESPLYIPAEKAERPTSEDLLELVDRVRAYPGVEAVSLSDMGAPYIQALREMNIKVDTVERNCRWTYVTPDYFTVFRILDSSGKSAPLAEAMRDGRNMVLSANFGYDRLEVGKEVERIYMDDHFRLGGICQPIRRSEYEPPYPVAFVPLMPKDVERLGNTQLEVCMRVTPEADGPDFARRFQEEMSERLRLGNIYLFEVWPLAEERATYIRSNGMEDELRARVAIAGFLLVNIFLGIIGTFWFRTEYRRGEMGLRMAVGSTRGSLGGIMVGEGLLLFLLAFLPSLLISGNIALLGLVDTYRMPLTWQRFMLTEGVTFLLVAGMIVCGVWYPARRVSRLEPAEALRYDG